MVDKIVTPRAPAFVYAPNTRLGRSGYATLPADQLAMRIEQLGALMCLITNRGADRDHLVPLQRLNKDIQVGVLDLVASLAAEIHEIHEEILFEGLNAPATAAEAHSAKVGG